MILLLIFGAGAVWLSCLAWGYYQDNRSYEGKTVWEWLALLESGNSDERQFAEHRFREMGPTILPGLNRALEAQDFYFRKKVWSIPRLPRTFRRKVLPLIDPPTAAKLRSTAAQAIVLVAPDTDLAVSSLLKTLRDPEPVVQYSGVVALAKLGKNAEPELLKLLEDHDSQVRANATKALAGMTPVPQDALRPLTKLLNDDNPETRSVAKTALEKLQPEPLEELLDILQHGTPQGRAEAAYLLTRFQRSFRKGLPFLMEMARDQSPTARSQAVEALGALGPHNGAVLNAICNATKDPAPEVRVAAVRALGFAAADQAAICDHLTACLSDDSPDVRAWSARLLGGVGRNSLVLTNLMRLLQDLDPKVSLAASNALERLGPGNQTSIGGGL